MPTVQSEEMLGSLKPVVARPVLGVPYTVLNVDPARCRQRQDHDASDQAAQRAASG